jgi:hypothetical protein
MGADGWESAPSGSVLDIGGCGSLDADHQGCARGLFHPGQMHQHTGLRIWLETTADDTIIRLYPGDRADELEAMEAPLFAAHGFVPVTRRGFERTTYGATGVWRLFGAFLRAKNVFRLRAVSFAKRGA